MSTTNELGLPVEPLRDLTAEEIAAYEDCGAAVIRNILPAAWVDRMRPAIDEILANPPPTGMEFNDAGDGRFYVDNFLYLFNEDFRSFAMHSPLPKIAVQAMRSRTARLFHDQILAKEAGTRASTPWHADISYWPIRGGQAIALWIPFDEAGRENGVVRYVRGSHKSKTVYRGSLFTERRDEQQQAVMDAWLSEEFSPIPEDIDSSPDKYEILEWEVMPGDLILHHPNVIHGARGNSSASRRRRAVAARYAGDSAYYKAGIDGASLFDYVTPHFGEVGLKDGDPLGGRYFPQVWPRV